MSNSLTLFNNTLIKLVSRSGTETERQTITLDVGEFGYTTDSKRLYIGDGATPGGIIVGNVFKGFSSNILSIGGTPRLGDSAYDTATKTLYSFLSGATNDPTNWRPIGGFYSSGNGTIAIDSSNNISVSSISANNISRDALGKSLTLSSGRVTLSARIAVNEIATESTTNLKLPTDLTLGTQNYRLTATPIPGGVLTTDVTGNLQWTTPVVPLLSVANTNTGLVSAFNVFTNPATLTLGNGLTGSYGGTPSSTFPVSGNITISSIFNPTAQVSFSQTGSIIRSVGVVSVSAIDIEFSIPGDITTNLNNMYKNFKWGDARRRYPKQRLTDRPKVFGLYRITLSQPINTFTSVVDVRAVNDIFSLPTLRGQVSDFHTPALGHRYFIESSTRILISFHSVAFDTPNSDSSKIDAFVLTSGDNSEDTRFNVTVYA